MMALNILSAVAAIFLRYGAYRDWNVDRFWSVVSIGFSALVIIALAATYLVPPPVDPAYAPPPSAKVR